jgi:hypothetical protein
MSRIVRAILIHHSHESVGLINDKNVKRRATDIAFPVTRARACSLLVPA